MWAKYCAASAAACAFVSAAVAVGSEVSPSVNEGTVRFLVAEVGDVAHGDSYVLPLSDGAAIAHARKLIEMGPAAGRKIVSAWVAPGANGINRDYLAPEAPAWSWHVTGLREFTDLTAEIFDGWPTFVEADVEGWMRNTEGQIGFWDYSVVAELPVGDYDADLDVDADDYAVWRAGLGGTDDLSADGSGNGVVDAADYVLWRRNLGTKITLPGRRAAAVVVGVPEPGTLSLMCTGLVMLFLLRRREAQPQAAWWADVSDATVIAKFVRAGVGFGGAGAGGGRVRDGLG